MDIEELQDFCDWEIKRRGGFVGELGLTAGGEGEFSKAVVDICVLARRQGIDIVDAVASEIEDRRKAE